MVSYLTHFLGVLPGWVRRIHLFLDNMCSTNKNFYAMAWAYKMHQQGRCDFLRISFLMAGHTKFSPDLLFSQVAKSYNQSDVFMTLELGDIIRRYATVTIDDGSLVCDWREPLSKKYSKFPGIRSQHDFVFAKKHTNRQSGLQNTPLLLYWFVLPYTFWPTRILKMMSFVEMNKHTITTTKRGVFPAQN